MGLLDETRSLLDQGPLCDSCLGRVFAQRSHGLANTERGRALRVTCRLEADEPYEPLDDCWVCQMRSSEVEEWARWAANELADVNFETYQVGTRVPPLIEENDRLLREEAGLEVDVGESFKREMNREVGKVLGDLLEVTVDFDRPDVVVLLDLEEEAIDVQINPAFVFGRYRKVQRGLSQTEWPCRECDRSGMIDGEPCDHCGGSGYMYEESVEGLVSPPVREAMEGTAATFHGAGREDVDARMLGTGRPFVVEVERPHRRFPDIEALEVAINDHAGGVVEVDDIALATYEMVERVKELPASKTYRATVTFESSVSLGDLEAAVNELRGSTIAQETPRRVSHRRAAKTRHRTVYDIEAELEDDRHGTVEVHGEGGLYIKELLHGDRGRTEPSLAGLLGVGIEVETLDVLAVEAEEGQFDEPAYLIDPLET